MPHPIPLLHGLHEVAGRYDAVILDLWGVVHDGERAIPGVAACLAELKRRGIGICLLSNAPRRAAATVRKLEGMGLMPDLWDVLLTSGEAVFHALSAPPDDWHRALGPRLLHIGPPRDNDIYEGVPGRVRVATPDEADFVVNTGIDDYDETLADYEPILRACAARRLPMICANPDLVVHVGPRLVICAGELARFYETLGCEVRHHGKPHPPVYRRCLELLGNPRPDRVLAVGDSLRTDIAGANAAGLDALLVTGGIHRDELGTAWDERPDPERLAALVATSGLRLTAAIPRLTW